MALKHRLHRWALAVYDWQPTHRQRLMGYVLVVAAFTGGLWRVEMLAQLQRHENMERLEDNCRFALIDRDEDRQVLVDMVQRAGGDQEILDLIDASYADRPDPVPCTEIADGS